MNGDSVLTCGTGGELLGQIPVCRGSGNLNKLSFKCYSPSRSLEFFQMRS